MTEINLYENDDTHVVRNAKGELLFAFERTQTLSGAWVIRIDVGEGLTIDVSEDVVVGNMHPPHVAASIYATSRPTSG